MGACRSLVLTSRSNAFFEQMPSCKFFVGLNTRLAQVVLNAHSTKTQLEILFVSIAPCTDTLPYGNFRLAPVVQTTRVYMMTKRYADARHVTLWKKSFR